MTRKQIAVEKFDCPKCGAQAVAPCLDVSRWAQKFEKERENAHPHRERVLEARKAGY